MLYDLKIIMDGNEILDIDDGVSPCITNLRYTNSATSREMELGACASDSISFGIKNTSTGTYDGSVVELYIHPQDDSALDGLAEIEESVGDSTDGEDIDPSDIESVFDEDESGEEMTPEEIAESELVEADGTETEFTFFEGIDLAAETIETDEGEEEEWTKIGTFYVYQQVNSVNDNSITLTCYDGMARLTGIFVPTSRQGTAQDIFDDLCNQITENYGIQCDEEEMPDMDINWTITCSYRDAFGYMSGLVGGYAMIGSDDTLGIDYYTYNETIILDDEVNSYNETSGGEMIIGAIECDRGINQSDIISVGAGQQIGFKNPFMTDDQLSNIYDMYKSVRYTGADAVMNWHDGIIAGQFVRIMTAEEYANYVAYSNAYAEAIDDATTSDEEILDIKASMNYLGKVILICSQTIDFSGNAKSAIKSIGLTEYEKENPTPSPVDARFRNLYAEMIEADYLTAKGAFIADLAANNFTVGSINGHAIEDSTILASALSSSAIQTLSGTHVYYQAIAPTTNLKVGDVWYKTVVDAEEGTTWSENVAVWNGNEWVTTPLDATMFRAGSITAREIAGQTITADEINLDSLQTNLSRIGAEDDDHLTIRNRSINLIVGNKNYFNVAAAQDGSSVSLSLQISQTSGASSRISNDSMWISSDDGFIQISPEEIGLSSGSGPYTRRITIENDGDITAYGNITSQTGSLSGKINGNFAYSSHTIISSASIGAEGYTEGTTAISKSGYYPLAISQWNSTTRYWSLNRCYFTNQAVGSATLNWMVANHHSSAHSASMTVQVLWCKA